MTRKPNRYRKIGQATLLGSCFGAGPAGFAAWQLLKKMEDGGVKAKTTWGYNINRASKYKCTFVLYYRYI